MPFILLLVVVIMSFYGHEHPFEDKECLILLYQIFYKLSHSYRSILPSNQRPQPMAFDFLKTI